VTDTAWVITILYTVASIIAVALLLVVFRSTRVGFRVRAASREDLERRESYWGVIAISLLVVTLGGTIFAIPYGSDQDVAGAKQKLKIVGRQFAWTISPPRVKVGVPTAIELGATDVNHAIGIYDPDEVLVKQVNIVPGVTQPLKVTFEKPGRYRIRCMEFCGVDHHLMENTLEVTR
jgi:cytochrome c oxidase subunit II